MRSVQTPIEDDLLQKALLELHQHPALLEEEVTFDFVHRALDAGADEERVACAVAPLLVSCVHRACVPVVALCRLATRLASDSRLMLHDVDLFRGLAVRWVRDTRRLPLCILELLRAGEYHRDMWLTSDLASTGLILLQREAHGGEAYRAAAAVVCLVLGGSVELRSALSRDLAELWRTGWPEVLGEVLTVALDTTSVEMLVCLERCGRLDSLREAADRHESAHWRRARVMLEAQWPREDEERERVEETCPITLERIRWPVVASDGHTYERIALLRHLCVLGATSPMTRQALSYHLFANRALLS